MLITFTNSLNPDQTQLKSGLDLDSTFLTLIVLMKEFVLKKISAVDNKSLQNYLIPTVVDDILTLEIKDATNLLSAAISIHSYETAIFMNQARLSETLKYESYRNQNFKWCQLKS